MPATFLTPDALRLTPDPVALGFADAGLGGTLTYRLRGVDGRALGALELAVS